MHFEIKNLPSQDVVIKGVCNLLMSLDNAQLGLVRSGPIGLSVAAVGNWVGGRYALTRTHLHFEMNRLNKGFQDDQSATHIPLETITGFKKGRMLLIAATVDVGTKNALYRFRLAPGRYRALLAELSRLCPNLSAPH